MPALIAVALFSNYRGQLHFLVQPVSLFNCANEFSASGFKACSLCVNGMHVEMPMIEGGVETER